MANPNLSRDERGLTLIELLITISVLAVVSAIALPVINNVVTSSNSNAYNQTVKDAQAFIDRYSKGGVVVYDGLRTLSGYLDSDGDNQIEAGEKIDTFTLDEKYAMTVTGSAQEGGSYSNGGVTAANIQVAGGGSTASAGNAAITITAQYSGLLQMYTAGATQATAWSTQTPVYADSSQAQGAPAGTYYSFTTVAGAQYMMNNGTVVVNDGVYTVTEPNGRVTIFTHYVSDPTVAGWTKGTL